MTTWTKLRDGSWGLRATEALVEGATIVVAKKDGSTSTVKVGRAVWNGNGVWLYAVAPTADKPAARRKEFIPCGYPGCNPGYCDECDGEGATFARARRYFGR